MPPQYSDATLTACINRFRLYARRINDEPLPETPETLLTYFNNVTADTNALSAEQRNLAIHVYMGDRPPLESVQPEKEPPHAPPNDTLPTSNVRQQSPRRARGVRRANRTI